MHNDNENTVNYDQLVEFDGAYYIDQGNHSYVYSAEAEQTNEIKETNTNDKEDNNTITQELVHYNDIELVELEGIDENDENEEETLNYCHIVEIISEDNTDENEYDEQKQDSQELVDDKEATIEEDSSEPELKEEKFVIDQELRKVLTGFSPLNVENGYYGSIDAKETDTATSDGDSTPRCEDRIEKTRWAMMKDDGYDTNKLMEDMQETNETSDGDREEQQNDVEIEIITNIKDVKDSSIKQNILKYQDIKSLDGVLEIRNTGEDEMTDLEEQGILREIIGEHLNHKEKIKTIIEKHIRTRNSKEDSLKAEIKDIAIKGKFRAIKQLLKKRIEDNDKLKQQLKEFRAILFHVNTKLEYLNEDVLDELDYVEDYLTDEVEYNLWLAWMEWMEWMEWIDYSPYILWLAWIGWNGLIIAHIYYGWHGWNGWNGLIPAIPCKPSKTANYLGSHRTVTIY